MWKIDPKDKYVHKNKHDHIQAYISNMFVEVKHLFENWGRREKKRE
jgi:hypothetical protein